MMKSVIVKTSMTFSILVNLICPVLHDLIRDYVLHRQTQKSKQLLKVILHSEATIVLHQSFKFLLPIEQPGLFDNEINFDKATLTAAIQYGYLPIVAWLYSRVTNKTFHSGEINFLDWAASNGNLELVKFLLADNSLEQNSAISMAANRGHLDVIKYLHANANKHSHTNAIMYAAKNGYLDIVKWLWRNGYPCDKYVLVTATEQCHYNIVKWLYLNTKYGCRAKLLSAASKNKCVALTCWFLNSTFNPSKCACYGCDALKIAIDHLKV